MHSFTTRLEEIWTYLRERAPNAQGCAVLAATLVIGYGILDHFSHGCKTPASSRAPSDADSEGSVIAQSLSCREYAEIMRDHAESTPL